MVNTLEIQNALQDALPDRRFTVNTRLNDDELIIAIERSRRNEINYQALTEVVENNLMDWHLEGIKKLKFLGRIHYHNQPEWQQIFEINEKFTAKKANQIVPFKPNRFISIIFNGSSKKLTVKTSSRLRMIKLALLGAGIFTLISGLRVIDDDELAGFHLLSIAAVMTTGLAVVEAIDIVYQEIRVRH